MGGSGGETESTLALAENVYVKVSKKSFHSKFSVAELLKLGKKIVSLLLTKYLA